MRPGQADRSPLQQGGRRRSGASSRLQSLLGATITIPTELREQARSEAFAQMCNHADRSRTDAIIAARCDSTDVIAGLTEVLCYGAAGVTVPRTH